MQLSKNLGLGAAKKSKDKTKKLMGYSKQWNPGDTMRLTFPIEWEDENPIIIATMVWGHAVNDFEGVNLKTTLIPSLTEFDENGSPVGRLDVSYQFSQIAPIFVRSQKAREEAALLSKNYPTEASRQDALRKLEHKFDTKNNPKAIKPAIGKATLHIFSEVACVKMVNGTPSLDSAAVVSFRLSNQRIDQILALFNDPKYAPMPGDEYWEIEWVYPANPDKNASGRASNPSGLTSEYRMVNQFPNEYKQYLTTLQGLSHSSETMYCRAVKEIQESKIASALSQYAIMHSEDLDGAIEDDVDTLVRNASLIRELNLERTLTNVELLGKITDELSKAPSTPSTPVPELVPDLAAYAPTTPTAQVPTPAPAPTPVVPDLSQTAVPDLNPAAPTMESLMNNQTPITTAGLGSAVAAATANPNFSGGEMEDVDLSMM